MADIDKVRQVTDEFLRKALKVSKTKVIKAEKVSDGWKTEAEVYEESSFIKSLGLPTRVQDRNIYALKLNNELNVQSYERKSGEEPEE